MSTVFFVDMGCFRFKHILYLWNKNMGYLNCPSCFLPQDTCSMVFLGNCLLLSHFQDV